MTDMEENKKQYVDFDDYILHGTPTQRERAEIWNIAIGLQAVDGLKVSPYLLELARKNIEGELTLDEVTNLLDKRSKEKQQARSMKGNQTYTRVQSVDKVASWMGRNLQNDKK